MIILGKRNNQNNVKKQEREILKYLRHFKSYYWLPSKVRNSQISGTYKSNLILEIYYLLDF